MLQGKTVVLGITGGIAAYKAADLVRKLRQQGADVHVIMTEAAQKFITPLTLRTLSQNPVASNLFAEPDIWEVKHISLADRADLLAIVPATANIIGKIANGIADDLLSTVVMATAAPVLIAPALNVRMYENPIFQENLKKLAALGCHIVEPDEGFLACGVTGKGRLADVDRILARIDAVLNQKRDMEGLKVLVTAGPTREAIDPVRFLTNHSSGKMGYAIAEAAQRRGAEVTLISGPTNLPGPDKVTRINVVSALEMYQAVLTHFFDSDVVIKAAAVADFRPAVYQEQKIKKKGDKLILELERNPDILLELGRRKGNQILIGFAAESQEILTNAGNKLREKNLDMIVANDITQMGAGFVADTNLVTFLFPDGRVEPQPLRSKREVADKILDEVVALRRAKDGFVKE